jgi:hypothetical protein
MHEVHVMFNARYHPGNWLANVLSNCQTQEQFLASASCRLFRHKRNVECAESPLVM